MRKTTPFILATIAIVCGFLAMCAKLSCEMVAEALNAEQEPEIVFVYEAPEPDVSTSPSYTDDELDLLARLIHSEAGSDWLTDEHQRAVGSVVLNRVADSRFPDTLEGVVYQKGQYACVPNGMINQVPTERAINNARYLLENGTTIPSNVVWQAQFKQGKGLWKEIQGHYFCY